MTLADICVLPVSELAIESAVQSAKSSTLSSFRRSELSWRSRTKVAAPFTQAGASTMYVVLFLDQTNYEFIVSLHSSLPRAEAAYEALLRRFVVKPGETLPPKASWSGLFDDSGESSHVYRIDPVRKLV
jgi:hypothetical protein